MVEERFFRGKAFFVGNEHFNQMKPDSDIIWLDRKFKRSFRIGYVIVM